MLAKTAFMNTIANYTADTASAEHKEAGNTENGFCKKINAYFNKQHFEYVVNNDVQVQKQAGYIATFYPGTMTIKIELDY